MPEAIATPGRLVPPVPLADAATPSSRRLLWHYRTNGLRAWPKAAYHDDLFVREMFGRTTVLLNRPDDIRHVLVENDGNYGRTRPGIRIIRPLLGMQGLFLATGDDWRRQRRSAAPAFAPRAVPGFARHSAEALAEALAELPADGGAGIELLAWFQGLALDVAGRALLSLPLRAQAPQIRAILDGYGRRYGKPGFLDFFLPLGFPGPRDLARRLFQRRWFRLVDSIIAAREKTQPTAAGGDLLDVLAAPDGSGPGRETLRSRVATFLVAGHETTAVTLFWTCWLLAQAPDWQERIAAEAAMLDLGPDGAADAVTQLDATRAVVNEALRLYPPAFVIVRMAKGCDRLSSGAVTAGSVMMIAPWVLHRHRRLWDDPDAFAPQRFLPGAPPPDRFAFLPFGAGPRVCIGASLAMVEAVLATAALVRRYRLGLDGDGPPVQPVAIVTTQPDRRPGFRLDRR